MFNPISLRRQAPWALLLALLAWPAPAYAQEADDEDEDERAMEEIVVTGSRIRRDDFSSASPISVITGTSVLESGFANLGEALRNTAVSGTAGFNQSSVLSGGGSTSVDLRGLGPDRVLILINGKRVASFADALANQAVDLTFVPNAMIERVEILRDGASAVYGADAVAGVVNVILKDSFEGIEGGVSTGLSGEGDAQRYTAELAVGASGDRGSVVLGGEYRYSNNVPQRSRDWAFPAISSLRANDARNGSFFSPGGVFFGDGGALFCTQPKAFGGDEVTNSFPSCPSFAPFEVVTRPEQVTLQRYDYALQQDIFGGSEVYAFAGYGTYDVTEGIEAFLEAQYSKRQSEFRIDGNPGSFGTVSVPQGWRVPATNPNNPTGQSGNLYIRPTTTVGARVSNHESDTVRIAAGFRGDLVSDGWLNEWAWEVSYLFTRVDADLRTNSVWNLHRANIISDPERCAADAICSAAVNPSGALDALRPGNWTADEIAYIRQSTLATSEFQTTGFFAMVTGPVAELPAGEVNVAFGFETRTDRGFNKPDPVTEAGESVANQVFTTSGSFTLNEYFGEIEIPVLADKFAVESLDLNLQARSSDYSNFGRETVWRAGINWQIIPDVRLRANRSTAYRAPLVTDLFSGGVVSFDFFSHPCAEGSADRSPGNNVDQNCLLDGIAANTPQAAGQFAVLSGGNPNLTPETADTSTIGLVLTPRFLDGFSATIDAWNIKVLDLITRYTSDSVVDSCYQGPVGKTDEACERFTSGVGPGGIFVRGMTNQLLNASAVSTRGFDLGIRYELDGPWDTFVTVDFTGTYVDKNTFYPFAGGASDRGSNPRIQAVGYVTVDKNDWDYTWRLRYVHGLNDPRYDGNNAFGYDEVPSHTEHDVRVGWRLDAYRFLLGVNDVFDNDPPYVFSTGTNTDLFLYGAVGRYAFLRMDFNM